MERQKKLRPETQEKVGWRDAEKAEEEFLEELCRILAPIAELN